MMFLWENGDRMLLSQLCHVLFPCNFKDKGFTAICLFWPHLTLEPHVKNHSMVVLLASRAPLMLRYVLNIPQSPQAHWVNQLKPGPTSSTFPRRLLQTRTHHGNTMTTRVSVSSGKWPSHRLRGVSMLIWSGSKWFSLSNLRVPLRSSYFQVSCAKPKIDCLRGKGLFSYSCLFLYLIRHKITHKQLPVLHPVCG